jgi:hypothetical protein
MVAISKIILSAISISVNDIAKTLEFRPYIFKSSKDILLFHILFLNLQSLMSSLMSNSSFYQRATKLDAVDVPCTSLTKT